MFHTDMMKAGFCVCNLERAESICLWNESCWHLSSGQSRWAVFQSMSRRRRTHGRTSWSSGVNRWRYRRSPYCETITIWTIKQSSVFCMTINHICQQNLKRSEMRTFIKKSILLHLQMSKNRQSGAQICLELYDRRHLKTFCFYHIFQGKRWATWSPVQTTMTCSCLRLTCCCPSQ